MEFPYKENLNRIKFRKYSIILNIRNLRNNLNFKLEILHWI
jgi:hypothetical protein